MMRSRRIIVLLALPLFMLLTLPAAVMLQVFPASLKPLALYEVEGLFWRGSAALQMDNVSPGRLSWRFAPGALLQGRVGFDVRLQGAQASGQARLLLAGGEDRALRLENLSVRTLASELARISPLDAQQVQGRLTIEMTEMTVTPEGAVRGQGSVMWSERKEELLQPGQNDPLSFRDDIRKPAGGRR